jgi:hypothetical protein
MLPLILFVFKDDEISSKEKILVGVRFGGGQW